MNIRAQVRTLAVGSMLVLAGLSLPATHAYAAPKQPKDNGVRCAYFDRSSGSWQFYLPGATINLKDKNGNLYVAVCGEDGNWFRQGAGSGSDLQGSGGNVATP
jgi:hypothetical protein